VVVQLRKDSLAMGNTLSEGFVVFRHHSGAEVRAGLLRLNRYLVAIEVYTPSLGLGLSDVLSEMRIVAGDRTMFSGRGVVTAIVNTGPMIICEAALDDDGFQVAPTDLEAQGTAAQTTFRGFLNQWQRVYRVLPEFKIATADLSAFLTDLRFWLDQVELEIRAAPGGSRTERELAAVETIGPQMTSAFNELRDRLEETSSRIDQELRPAHQSFCRRHLHGLTMCSPFAYRTFHKPLGYAGDYEMVNMILRNPFEGASLYAKVMNQCFLSQWPAEAHRNRIEYLKGLLKQESLRGARRNRPVRILNLGCGPAHEISQFIAENALSDYADFVLMDFNEETLQYASEKLLQAKTQYQRQTRLTFRKKSVQQLIKESIRPGLANEERYDLIYCAGLFDYLADRTCKQLMALFYRWLEPGGLVAATNVDDCKPFRTFLEFLLDWHLIYRGTKDGEALLPGAAAQEDSVVRRDVTGVNIFVEARKPAYG
jgi:extracellular factor (EF) 3-hydroxypalmitic acid methyl ester biosynthesis protein